MNLDELIKELERHRTGDGGNIAVMITFGYDAESNSYPLRQLDSVMGAPPLKSVKHGFSMPKDWSKIDANELADGRVLILCAKE